jgi:hypothetical protein
MACRTAGLRRIARKKRCGIGNVVVIPARRIGCMVAHNSDMTLRARSALSPSSPAALVKTSVTMAPGEIVGTRMPRLLISDATLRE